MSSQKHCSNFLLQHFLIILSIELNLFLSHTLHWLNKQYVLMAILHTVSKTEVCKWRSFLWLFFFGQTSITTIMMQLEKTFLWKWYYWCLLTDFVIVFCVHLDMTGDGIYFSSELLSGLWIEWTISFSIMIHNRKSLHL